jgi:hypothetical protein
LILVHAVVAGAVKLERRNEAVGPAEAADAMPVATRSEQPATSTPPIFNAAYEAGRAGRELGLPIPLAGPGI